MKTSRGFLRVSGTYVLFTMALGLVTISVWAQTTINANWIDSTDNWTDASNWSCNCVPNNSSANVFNVTIPSGDVSLDATSSLPSITINTLGTSSLFAPTFSILTSLYVVNGESLGVTGDVNVKNGSSLEVDTSGLGGSTVHIGGNLTNESYMQIGIATVEGSSTNMSSASTVTVAGTLNNTGQIFMYGGNAPGAAALLSVGGTAPSTLTGGIVLQGDTGGAAVEYGSGSIVQISGALYLDGSDAYVESSAAPGSNSALTGLKLITGSLYLDDGASLSTTGPLTIGDVSVDGGSTLHVGGNLAISSGFDTLIVNASTVTVAGALTNTSQYGLSISGGNSPGTEALLNVKGAAPSTLTGNFGLAGNSGGAAVEYGGGAITQIGDGSTHAGSLALSGPNAFMELSSAKRSNSAMAGLNTIASNGELDLEAGASFTTASDLTNDGDLYVEVSDSGAVSTLHVGGNLTNAGLVDVDGILMAPTVDLAGGRLLGSGTIKGNVVSNATVSPSDPSQFDAVTTLTIDGNYTQGSDGTLVIDIASATDFSILDVSGDALLDGTVDFDFLNGYVPGANTDFAFLKAGSATGDFAALNLVGIKCPSCTFNLSTLSLDTGSTQSTQTPEPGTLVLFGTALLGLAALLLKKRTRTEAAGVSASAAARVGISAGDTASARSGGERRS